MTLPENNEANRAKIARIVAGGMDLETLVSFVENQVKDDLIVSGKYWLEILADYDILNQAHLDHWSAE